MATNSVLLRPRKTYGSITRESCLFRSMLLGISAFCLPMLMLTGCAAEGHVESAAPETEPILQVNATDVSTVTLEGDSQSTTPETEPILQVNATDVSTVTLEGDSQSTATEPKSILKVNAAGEMEDVMTATPKGGFQNEPTEAEPIYSPL